MRRFYSAIFCIATVLLPFNQAKISGKYLWDATRQKANPADVRRLTFNATAGQTFPNFSTIPKTNFSCDPFDHAGLYADVDSGCQAFYQCDVNGNQHGYLCSPGTIFNQLTLTCDYWYNVNCKRSPAVAEFANLQDKLDGPEFDKCFQTCSKETCNAGEKASDDEE